MATTKAKPPASETQSSASLATTRQRILAERQAAVRIALSAVDATLRAVGGRRLSEPTALGSVLVEASSDGLGQLKQLPEVRAVLKDQPIRGAD